MDLNFMQLGSGDPVIILHGLYGSADNWFSIGRDLAGKYSVFLVDQRNHGNSPHHPEHNYDVLSNDLNDFMQGNNLDQAAIIGHSMGGKTALAFGLKYPRKVSKMIVVDISPFSYGSIQESAEGISHKKIISALQMIDAGHINSREEADKQLALFVSSRSVRQFLLKNLKRTPDGKFRWSLNIQVLANNMQAIFNGVIQQNQTDPLTIPQFPLLFIKGEQSGYLQQADEEAIRLFFPWAGFVVIPGAGHWVHAEQPAAFIKIAHNFLET
jgi:esterase